MKRIIILTATLGGFALAAQEHSPTYTPLTADAATVVLYHFDEPAAEIEARDAGASLRNASYGDDTTHDTPSLPGLGTAYSPAGSEKPTSWQDTEGWTSVLYTLPSSSFTIEMWIKFDHLEFPGNVPLVTIQSEQSFPNLLQPVRFFDYSLEICPVDPDYHFSGALTLKGANSQVITERIDWTPGQWYYIAVTFEQIDDESGIYRFYRTQAGDFPEAMPFSERRADRLKGRNDDLDGGAPRRLLIGSYPGVGKKRAFPGLIDELRISTEARTSFPTKATP